MTENDAIRYLEITKNISEESSVGYLQRQMCEKSPGKRFRFDTHGISLGGTR